MLFETLLIAGLTCWRVTKIIHSEKIAEPIRLWVGGVYKDGEWVYPPTFVGNLFSCFWCLSVWIGFFCCVVAIIEPILLLPLAISTIAIIIDERGIY